MEHYFKKLKTLVAILLIVPFFSFSEVAYADNTSTVSDCVTNAVASGLTTTATTLITQKTLALSGGTGALKGEVMTSVSVPISNTYLGTISGLNEAHSSFQDLAKMDLDSLAYSTAQCMLTMLTDNTVNWIKGGFNGSPSFAVDVRGLTEDIAKGVASDFANKIKNLQACDFTPNFVDDLANSISVSSGRSKQPPKIQCPFSPQTVSAQQFYKDFNTLGWKGMAMALNDKGNKFGVNVLTSREIAKRQAEAKATNDKKLSWSNGFTDMLDLDPDKCQYPPDIDQMMRQIPPTPYGGLPLEDATISYYQKTYCPTTTPGKVISDSLMKAIGAKQDRIGFADNMNKLIAALIGELTNEAVHGIFKAAGATPATGSPYYTGYSYNNSATNGAVPLGVAPYVSSGTVSSIASTSATLDGSIQYPSLSGSAWFIWTTSATDILTPAGNTTSQYYFTAFSDSPTTYSAELTGLNAGTTYYYLAVGQTSQGVWYGAPQSFTTKPI